MPTEAELASSYRADENRLLAMYGLTASERMVTAPDGVELHTIEVPGDPSRPPVVLLHGAASVTAAAIPLIPAFDGRRVIAPDWPGTGCRPRRPSDRMSCERGRSAGCRRWWMRTGSTRSTWSGTRWAGSSGCTTRSRSPIEVRRLVLLGAPGAAFREMRAPFAFRLIALPWIGRGAFSREVTLAQYGTNSALTLGQGTVDAWPPELVAVGWYASQREAFKSTLPYYYPAITGFFGTRRASIVQHDELATLRMPVLGLWGDEDVFLTPSRGAPSARAIPDFEEVVLHAGHAPWLNKPEASSAAVRSFLA